MAVLIPEAVEAATAGEAAVSGTAARGASARGAAAGAAAGTGRRKKTAAPPPARRQRFEKQARKQGKKAARSAGRDILRARVPGARNYQPVILAEFLLAVLVVAIPPLATGGDQTAQAKNSPSPYSGDSMKQLLAVGALYFILALMSGGKKLGRFSAWFGALVLIGLGLVKTANGDLQALFKVFAPGLAQGQGGETPAQIMGGAGLNPNAIINPFAGQDQGAGLNPGSVVNPFANVTQSYVSPPPGGQGVITTDTGTQLALPDAGRAVGHRGGRHDRQ